MTDPDLAYRVEQAYLGALLARQGRVGTGTVVAGDAGPDGFAGLRPQDFTDPVHQAIYAALAGQSARKPDAPYERLRGRTARLFNARARDAGAYMTELPGMCPEPANLTAYAAMVAEASELRADAPPVAEPEPARGNRRAATGNSRLASAGEWLDGTGMGTRPAGRQRPAPASPGSAPARASSTDPVASNLAPDVARLARALRADARSATRAAPGTVRPAMPPASQPAPLDAKTLQDQVLADLMRCSADGRDVASWLPDTSFTDGPHRSLYQLISSRLADGRPVDPLIMAWEASRLRDPGSSAGTPGTAEGKSLAATALRLGTLDPAPGTAAILGRMLYADQVCTAALGLDWTTEPERIPVPAAPGDESQRSEPGPSAAGQSAVSTVGDPDPSAAPAAEAARRTAMAAPVKHPMPAMPRAASSVLIQPPPAPGPAGPAPARRM